MRIKISTLVKQPYKKVFEGFDQNLFIKLAPPFPPVKLLRFDGCKVDDRVALRLNFIFFKQTWESLITDYQNNEQEISFVDEGVKLPFFLKYWKHHHRVVKEGEQTQIVDDISFKTPFFLFDYLMYPALYLQFLYRKPIYRKVFSN
jgi:ligand-binding SRPBCC domain-containing protein